MTPSARIVMVDKTMAEKLLGSMGINRPLAKRRVEFMKGIIARGEWKLTSDALATDQKGRLINGQHRLSAVVEMNANLPFLLIEGMDDEAFTVLDTGLKRSAAQTLALLGYANATNLASTARLVMLYNSGDMTARPTYTNDQIVAEIIGRQDGYNHWVSYGHTMAPHIRATGSALGAFGLIASEFYDPEELDEFLVPLKTGANLTEGDPRLAARNWLHNDKNIAHSTGDRNRVELGIINRAFNHWQSGQAVTLIRRWRFGEEFPRIIHP